MKKFFVGTFLALLVTALTVTIIFFFNSIVPEAEKILINDFSLSVDAARFTIAAATLVFIGTFLAYVAPGVLEKYIIRTIRPFLPLLGENATTKHDYYNNDELKLAISEEIEKALVSVVGSEAQTKVAEAVRQEIIKLEDAERDEIVSQATEKMSAKISETAIEKFTQERLQRYVVSSKEHALGRMYRLAHYLEQRASRALAVGISFCTLGLAFLFFISFAESLTNAPIFTDGEIQETSWKKYLQIQGPRVSLLLVVEIIGFFFLKLYVRTLAELRFTHNEITNIESKFIALSASQESARETALLSAIEALASTERNSIIEKGQTTIEIERERAHNEANKEMLNTLGTIVHGTEKGSIWNLFKNKGN
jgi:hypothetical protein